MGNALYREIDRLKAENEKLKSEIETLEIMYERQGEKLFHAALDAVVTKELKRQTQKWKSTVEEYRAALILVERDRNFWQEMAQRGGGNG